VGEVGWSEEIFSQSKKRQPISLFTFSKMVRTNLSKICFSKSKQGPNLKTPVTFNVAEPYIETERQLQEYIIDSLRYKMPKLVPFVIENSSMMQLAKHLFLHNSGSTKSLENYIRGVVDFCEWSSITPDGIVKQCIGKNLAPYFKGIAKIERLVDDYGIFLQVRGLSANTIINILRYVRGFCKANYINLQLYIHIQRKVLYEDRAPTIEELRLLLNTANLRERLIIAVLATSGLRQGTLSKLKYRHIKKDFERAIIPVHIHIEEEITKGKYHAYDTFLNKESTEYLRVYLHTRKIGTPKVPPEQINEESPLIRQQTKQVLPMAPESIEDRIHKLCFKSGVLTHKTGTVRYEFSPHSFRKFFRTQMAFLGVEREYINYMLGHKTDTYFDAEMKGIEYLRHVYQKSGISIKPQPEIGKIVLLKELILKLGLNPQEVLNQDFANQSSSTF
jgi:integrase